MDLGIIRHGRYLVYGLRRGWGRALPSGLQSVIVKVWNRIACALYGHDETLEYEGICCHCCREVRS